MVDSGIKWFDVIVLRRCRYSSFKGRAISSQLGRDTGSTSSQLGRDTGSTSSQLGRDTGSNQRWKYQRKDLI